MKKVVLATIIISVSMSLVGCKNSKTLNNGNETNKKVTIEQAKEMALKHANLTSDKVSFIRTETDIDNGVEKYDIEFYYENKEYDYEINAANGEIIEYDYDVENYNIPTKEDSNNIVNNQQSNNIDGNQQLNPYETSITVEEAKVDTIAIKTVPNKTNYIVGDTLDTEGLVITATYNNGTVEDYVEGFTCTPTELNTVGTQAITVTYEGKTATFDVTVAKKVITVTSDAYSVSNKYIT
ncbi:MAG: bacterial Ig-like domain-containing protein, partial [Bacilli bacterium]